MAATAVGRVLSLCRQFQVGLRLSSTLPIQPSALPVPRAICPFRQISSVFVQRPGDISVNPQYRSLHTTHRKLGLEEFFDLPENWGEATVKSGAPWTAKQLRTKSNEDLHKLWYVLLKERNMLLTVEQESKRQRLQMPSPERLRKVERSMYRLDTVVAERETAVRLLQTGQERPRPGDWRKNVFGKTYWYKFSEHPIPWHLNSKYRRKRFYTPSFVNPYIRLQIENYLRGKTRMLRAERERQRKLKGKMSPQSQRAENKLLS